MRNISHYSVSVFLRTSQPDSNIDSFFSITILMSTAPKGAGRQDLQISYSGDIQTGIGDNLQGQGAEDLAKEIEGNLLAGLEDRAAVGVVAANAVALQLSDFRIGDGIDGPGTGLLLEKAGLNLGLNIDEEMLISEYKEAFLRHLFRLVVVLALNADFLDFLAVFERDITRCLKIFSCQHTHYRLSYFVYTPIITLIQNKAIEMQ